LSAPGEVTARGERAAALTVYRRALARELHVLRRDPELVWQQLHNRLQWEGRSVEERLASERERRSGPGVTPWIRALTPLGESQTLIRTLAGHQSVVWACRVSSCGSFVVSASFDKTLKVWDAESGADKATLRGHSGEVLACAIAPDDSFIVSASADRTLKMWEVATFAERRTLKGHADEVVECLVSPDGRLVVSASKDGTLRIWDAGTGAEMFTLEGHAGPISACAISRDGKLLLSAGRDGTLKVWDVQRGRRRCSLEGHTQALNSCAVHPNGSYAVSAGKDRTVRVWDLDACTELKTLSGFGGDVTGCLFSPDGTFFVSFGLDLKAWNVGSWDERAALAGQAGGVQACAVSPDGELVIAGGWHHDLAVWDARDGSLIAKMTGHSGDITACAVFPDGRSLVSASVDHTLRIWEMRPGAAPGEAVARAAGQRCPGHSAGVTCLALSPDGSYIASGSGGAPDRLAIWEGDSLVRRASMTGHTFPVRAVGVSPDGSFVVSVGGDMLVWESLSGQRRPEIPKGPGTPGHVGGVWSFAISPDSRFIVSGGYDRSLKVWDSRTGALQATLVGHQAEVNGCSVSPDGRFIVSASTDQSLKVWDVESGSSVVTLHTDAKVSACAISADGTFVVSAEGRGRLKVWDAATGIERGRLDHADEITDFRVSPDSSFVVAADKAAGLRVWDPETCTERSSLAGHTGEVRGCAVTPDARCVVSIGSDDTLRIWDVEAGRERAVIALPGGLTALALHPSETRVLCGDRNGHLHSLEIVGLGYWALVVTAVQAGRGLRARCPACARPVVVREEWLGREIRCPNPDCGRSIRLAASIGRSRFPAQAEPDRRTGKPKEDRWPLAKIVEKTGLPFEEVDWRELVVHVTGRDGTRHTVRVTAEGEWVRLAMPVAGARRPVGEDVLRNLLRACHDAPYTKVLLLDFGDPVLSSEIPLTMLSHELATGLLLGIASLGEVRDLSDWGAWQTQIASCRSSQTAHYHLDLDAARRQLVRLAESAGTSLRAAPNGALIVEIELARASVPVLVLLEGHGLTVRLPLPWRDPTVDRESMLAMLKQNLIARAATIGLDARDKAVVSYQVPRVEQGLLADVQRQFSLILGL